MVNCTEEILPADTCIKGEQVWGELLPLLAGVILDTCWRHNGNSRLPLPLDFPRTFIHGSVCVFPFTSAARAAKEGLNTSKGLLMPDC